MSGQDTLRAELAALKLELANESLEPWQTVAIETRLRQVEKALAESLEGNK